MRLGADLVGLSGSSRSHLSEQILYTRIPCLLLVRSICKLDAFEALSELLNLIQELADYIKLRSGYLGVGRWSYGYIGHTRGQRVTNG